MGMFALCGFDSNRERKMKIKKIYIALIKKIRASDAKNQQKQLAPNETRSNITSVFYQSFHKLGLFY